MKENKLGIYFILVTICLALLTFSIIYTGIQINDLTEEIEKKPIIMIKEK